MNKKDNETERLEAEQSLYEHYWFDWYYGGRDRNAMIRWLKGNPHHVLEHHVDDLFNTYKTPHGDTWMANRILYKNLKKV